MSKKNKKIATRIFLTLGLLFLLAGFVPGFLSWPLGLILFVFSLVAVGLVNVVVSDREEELFSETEPPEEDKTELT